MTSFAQELVTVDRERLDLRASLLGLGVFAAFIAELTKHRAATIARFRPHDETTSPETATTDEDTGI